MNKAIQFPVEKKKIIKELNFKKFNNKLKYYEKKGYKVLRTSACSKMSGFGKVTGYFAELQL